MVIVASLQLGRLFVVITVAITIVVKNSRMKPITEKKSLANIIQVERCSQQISKASLMPLSYLVSTCQLQVIKHRYIDMTSKVHGRYKSWNHQDVHETKCVRF